MRNQCLPNFIQTDLIPEQNPLINQLKSDESEQTQTNNSQNGQCNRTIWMNNLLKNESNILHFRESVIPLDRSLSVGQLYFPQDRLLDQFNIFSLISQHFYTIGLSKSQESLNSEWDTKYEFPYNLPKSQLAFIIQRGIQHSESFWELTAPGVTNEDSEYKYKQRLFNEFAKIAGINSICDANIQSLVDSEDNSPISKDEILDFMNEKEENLDQAGFNNLLWICTTENKFYSDIILNSFILFSLFILKDPSIILSKIRNRFLIELEGEVNLISDSLAEIDIPNQDSEIPVNHNQYSSNSSPKVKHFSMDSSFLAKFPSLSNPSSQSEQTDTISASETEELNNEFTPHQIYQIGLTLKFLHKWIIEFGYYLSPFNMALIHFFLEKDVPLNFSKYVQQILDDINKENFTQNLSSLAQWSQQNIYPPKVELNQHCMPWFPNFELTSLPPIEFARQLTIWTSKYFYQIESTDLIYDFSQGNEKYVSNLQLLEMKSNKIFTWIQFCVFNKADINERVSCLTDFIRVAKRLFNMQNYYLCSIFLSACDNCLAYLKKTRNLIEKKKIIFVETAKDKIMNLTIDSSILRKFLLEQLAKKPTIPVLFPYKSSIQSTMNGSLIKEGKVNIPVMIELYKLINEFKEYQKKKLVFLPIDQAQELIEQCQSPKTLNELIDIAKKLE